ncbi:MAG: hypothetical protein A2277_06040 [Desulfobacterales bacterium RIFOXYA12_FULL_46_15]|nr:MAG: hypothetical protein A2277_06040 [Desulfobacterales bacterium RIFOXYA12_FULL_46_15]
MLFSSPEKWCYRHDTGKGKDSRRSSHISHSLKAMIKDRKDLVLSKELGPLSFDHDGRLSPVRVADVNIF